MQTSLSLNGQNFLDHQRIARAAVLNGVDIPARTAAVLEARGVNVGELERRLRQNLGGAR